MRLGRTSQDRDGIIMPPNTISSPLPGGPYWIHSYPNNNLKTLTFYHSDDTKSFRLDNKYSPASSLLQISNLRGNIPQYLYAWGQSSVQSASALSMSRVTNWATIKDCIGHFVLNPGDGFTPCANFSMPQDFLKDHPRLQDYRTSWGGCYNMGITDANFRISLLKSDWNTYFKELRILQISDAHWNREDLSQLTKLNLILIACRNQNNNNNPTNNPPIPMPAQVVDNIINQIAAGAGQFVQNGTLAIDNRTGPRTRCQ